MGGRPIREGVEIALRDPAHLDSGTLLPVLPLLVATVPLACRANPSEAFCGAETWVVPWPVLPILRLRSNRRRFARSGLLQTLCGAAISAATQRKLLSLARDGESALPESLPGERALAIRDVVVTETLDSRRPLIPQARGLKSLPLVARLHPADPPLEPQGGRPHNLLRIARIGRILHLNRLDFRKPQHRKQTLKPRQVR
jgi:hypothetical protein